jgi:hypothetical protein
MTGAVTSPQGDRCTWAHSRRFSGNGGYLHLIYGNTRVPNSPSGA